MSLQLLISTLNNKNILGLLDSLNVQSDAIVINQCDINECKIINYKDNNINVYNFSERGVGLSRNNALMRSTADFCLLTDDDMTYIDGYSQIVHNMFLKHPQADVIVFNLEENNNRYVIKKKFKVGYLNYMRFGAARIAIRRQSVIKNGISFNLCFGGGTPHGSGEDVLFLKDCIKKKLNIIAVPVTLAKLNDDRESTWFKGYDEKFFVDKGYLFGCISRKYAKLIGILNLIKNRSITKQVGFLKSIKLVFEGIRMFKNE